MKIEQKYINRLTEDWGISERLVEIPFVFEFLPEPPKKILDIGCLESLLLNTLNEIGFNAWGVDIREKTSQMTNFIKADARALPFEDDKFDITTCISTLEHIGLVKTPYKSDTLEDTDGDLKTMREIERVTKKNGLIIITIPYGLCHSRLIEWMRFYNSERLNKLIGNLDVREKRFFTRNSNKIWTRNTEEEASKMETTKQVVSVCLLYLRK